MIQNSNDILADLIEAKKRMYDSATKIGSNITLSDEYLEFFAKHGSFVEAQLAKELILIRQELRNIHNIDNK